MIRVSSMLTTVGLLACNSAPMPGAACSSSEPQQLFRDPSVLRECGVSGGDSLACAPGAGGCGSVAFTYRCVFSDAPPVAFCSCDGTTVYGIRLPSTSYRWVGSCEDPCADVVILQQGAQPQLV